MAVARILVVEDNPAEIELLKAACEEERLAAIFDVAISPDEALRQMAAQRPELVLVDYHLGEHTGDTLLGLMRSSPRLRDLPVLVVSTDLDRSERARLGPETPFHEKPSSFAGYLALARKLGALLQGQRA